MKTTRRDFLKVSAAMGGGLALEFSFPLTAMAAKGLLAMERQPLDMEVRTLVDVVLRHIPDVYRMPAFKTKRAKMFDTETIVEGRKVAEASV